MEERQILEAIERCYAGVACDRQFNDFIQWLGQEIGSDAGDVVVEYPDSDAVLTFASFGFDAGFLKDYDEAYLGKNPWYRELERRAPGRFHSSADFGEAFQSSTYQNEWVRAQGLDHSAGAVLASESGEIAWVGFVRASGSKGFGDRIAKLGPLVPHLRRAVALKTRIGQEEGVAGLIDRLAGPAMLLDARYRVVAANSPASECLDAGKRLTLTRGGRLVVPQGPVNQRLQTLLAAAWSEADGPTTLALGPDEQGEVAVLTAVKLGAAGLSGSRLLVTLSGAVHRGAGLEAAAAALGLSPTEQALASWIAAGGAVGDFARQRGISPGTARWHLKNIHRKTGTARLEQLVALLHRLAPVTQ